MKQYLCAMLCLLLFATTTKAGSCTISGPPVVIVNSSLSYDFTVSRSESGTATGTWRVDAGGIIESQTGALCKAKWTVQGTQKIYYSENQFCSASYDALVIAQSSVKYTYDNAGNRVSRTISMPTKAGKEEYVENDEANQGNAGVKPLAGSDAEIGKARFEMKALVDSTSTAGTVLIYPNPTQGQLQVELHNQPKNIDTPSVTVFDAQGHLVFESIPVVGKTMVDLQKQAAGNYLMVLRVGDKASTWNIVKVNE